DPALLPLADNGGLTRTYALGPASCAIDAGNPENTQSTEYDQRSFPYLRNIGAAPDIGAYERQAPGDAIFGDGFETQAAIALPVGAAST
ncbi:MAG TPA: choice-of-anchor Q domain-containing protein, partial [Dokdonella sp.]